jgi:hypothetical protein
MGFGPRNPLQSDYIRRQMPAFIPQAWELASKAATGAAMPRR